MKLSFLSIFKVHCGKFDHFICPLSMSVKTTVETYRAMRRLPMWELLASDTAPETLGCLQALLFDNEKSLPASVFISRLTDYLNEIEDATVESSQAAVKANLWRKSNFITLRYLEGQQEPVYELTSAAHEAIRFISSQRSERTSPTESRLELVIHAIRKLVLDTDVNIEDRVALLEEDRRRIEEQIALVRQGKVDVASDAEVRAQIFDLLEMLENLNGDFYRVRDRFYELSRELHEDIMRNDGTAGSILEGFFAGYDRISESEEGKTFRSFYNFINDPAATSQIEDAVDALQQRSFWDGMLIDKNRNDIAYMRRNLNLRARETQAVMKRLASSLKHVVQSRDYQQDRRISQLINDARREALQKREGINPQKAVFILPRSSVKVSSVSCVNLYDPQTEATPEQMLQAQVAQVDFSELARRVQESEINYPWLKSCVLDVLDKQQAATVADVLALHPAKQGLASVVGLISLALRCGMQNPEQSISVSWTDRFGQLVKAHIPMLLFTQASRKSLSSGAQKSSETI